MPPSLDPESQRLEEDRTRAKNWRRWGPYLSDRQWGTVREDYSENGDSWGHFPHDHARSRVYRWGEDGLLGITDRQCRLCFSLALWNGRDPILKERLFGLSGPEGNHGEDAKEAWFHLDATPTHTWLEALYRYPQAEFPYARLVEGNRARTRDEPEFDLEDTGVFDDGRYFDARIEYAKASPDDVLIRVHLTNHGPDEATLHVLPQLWFRNTWSWGRSGEGYWKRGKIGRSEQGVVADHETLGRLHLVADPANGPATWLFTDNETNAKRLWGGESATPYVKDAFHEYVVHGRADAVNPAGEGTKAALHHVLRLAPGETRTLRLRLVADAELTRDSFTTFDTICAARSAEADVFHAVRSTPNVTPEEARVVRAARAGLVWTKQFYSYGVSEWLEGDPAQPAPPAARRAGRNRDWGHLYNFEIISMPDKWEYPWYAAWDLAFHAVAFAPFDAAFAKEQLLLLLREWYMHPNGQIPAYEFNFGDVNPPVHAWACWRVYHASGRTDRDFLARAFHKLLINFTWWVNRKDESGRHLFAGGFLGLDNIGLFDRSRPLPDGGSLQQADGTGWMAFYCGTLLEIALELARTDPSYTDLASKLFEHFVAISDAMNTIGGTGLWDERDGFYYDELTIDGRTDPLRVRSLVGLVPIFASLLLEDETLDLFPDFSKRMKWFLDYKPDAVSNMAFLATGGRLGVRQQLLAIPSRERLVRVLKYVLDENEFLSPYGLRSLSKHHQANPVVLGLRGDDYRVGYEPGESHSGMFGGNSNWRGPVWFPLNYLFIEALERYHRFYGDGLKVEFPTGSGRLLNLREVARELCERLVSLLLPDADGRRPFFGADPRATDPKWRDLLLFHEYFHADTGRGLGAAHQTGWTALAANLAEKLARLRVLTGVDGARR